MKVGTRVKKVRSHRSSGIGDTGIFVCTYQHHRRGFDCLIRRDQPWRSEDGEWCPSGTVSVAISEQWEPIIPEGHKPAEASVEELLPFLKGVTA